jgi:hypothetical protein
VPDNGIPPAPDASPEPGTGGSSALRIAGLAVIAFGLVAVLFGLVLGVWEYNSPLEREIRDATRQAVNSLSGSQLEGGVVLTAAPYTPPGVGEYVVAQPPTVIGAIAVFAGFMLLAASASRGARAAHESADGIRDLPPDDRPLQEDDSVFDTGD